MLLLTLMIPPCLHLWQQGWKKHAFFVERFRLPCCHLQAAAENQGEQTDLDVIDSSLQRGSKHTL